MLFPWLAPEKSTFSSPSTAKAAAPLPAPVSAPCCLVPGAAQQQLQGQVLAPTLALLPAVAVSGCGQTATRRIRFGSQAVNNNYQHVPIAVVCWALDLCSSPWYSSGGGGRGPHFHR